VPSDLLDRRRCYDLASRGVNPGISGTNDVGTLVEPETRTPFAASER
jgi:hypothetical protein